MQDIETVWRRIEQLQGQTFRQIRGAEFTYSVHGAYLRPNRTNQSIAKAHFAEALELVPLADTVTVQHLRRPSYLFAVLMDPRIRQGQW